MVSHIVIEALSYAMDVLPMPTNSHLVVIHDGEEDPVLGSARVQGHLWYIVLGIDFAKLTTKKQWEIVLHEYAHCFVDVCCPEYHHHGRNWHTVMMCLGFPDPTAYIW